MRVEPGPGKHVSEADSITGKMSIPSSEKKMGVDDDDDAYLKTIIFKFHESSFPKSQIDKPEIFLLILARTKCMQSFEMKYFRVSK